MKNAARFLLAASLITSLAGCGDDSSGGSSTAARYYPSQADKFDAGTGDNAAENAVAITTDTSYNKTLFPAGDTDWTSVTLNAGTTYEISANKLCATCDTRIYLYEEVEGAYVLRKENNDNIYLDSAVEFTPTETKEYFIQVTAYDNVYGIASYILNVHTFVDADEDEYSSFYDCNDNDDSIYPTATEVREDGIDQDCNGSDLIKDTTADAFENDDSKEKASGLPFLKYGHDEAVFIFQQHANDVHTLHNLFDEDWYKVTVPAHGGIKFSSEYGTQSLNYIYSIYKADGVNGAEHDEGLIINDSDNEETYYIRVDVKTDSEVNTGFYMPFAYFLGYDKDQDGYLSMDWDENRDCNDNNASINPGADETDGDSIDSNCDGEDNAPEVVPAT